MKKGLKKWRLCVLRRPRCRDEGALWTSSHPTAAWPRLTRRRPHSSVWSSHRASPWLTQARAALKLVELRHCQARRPVLPCVPPQGARLEPRHQHGATHLAEAGQRRCARRQDRRHAATKTGNVLINNDPEIDIAGDLALVALIDGRPAAWIAGIPRPSATTTATTMQRCGFSAARL